MPTGDRVWTDEQVDLMISNILRIGVSLSSAIVGFGAIVYLLAHGHEPFQHTTFKGEPDYLRSLQLIVMNAFRLPLQGQNIMQLGILVLLATPLIRVAFSVYAFARQRDLVFVVITLIVLSILLYSLMAHNYL